MELSGHPLSGECTSGEVSTLVLGIGNTLQGDDGLGVRVVEKLVKRKLPGWVEVREIGTPGLGLINEWQGWQKVIIIDATEMGEPPGTWKRFNPLEVILVSEDCLYSLHEPGLTQALQLAEAMDMLPEEIVVYGVEPGQVDWGENLSPAIQNTLPELVEKIYCDLWKRSE
jgi:hydrogenase maturation protease